MPHWAAALPIGEKLFDPVDSLIILPLAPCQPQKQAAHPELPP